MRINIYISQNTEDKLNEVRRKYHVSLSTVCQVLSDYFRPNFKLYGNEFLLNYKDTDHRNRTSVKPNNLDENSDLMQACKGELSVISHVLSNLLYYYANENYEMLFQEYNKNKLQRYKKDLEKWFLKKKEFHWNYNNYLRNQLRFFRKNPKVFIKMYEEYKNEVGK